MIVNALASTLSLDPSLPPEGMEHRELGRRRLFHGFLSVDEIVLQQRLRDGTWSPPFQRQVLQRGHAVAVLIHDPVLDRLLFGQQLRSGSLIQGEPWLLDVIAGMIDDGEDPTTTAVRESDEEAHVAVTGLHRIGRYYTSAGGCSETTTLYYGQADLSRPALWGGCPDENEIIRLVTMSVDESMAMLDAGHLSAASATMGLLWLRAERAQGRRLAQPQAEAA